MEYYLVVFSSRSHTLAFNSFLLKNGIRGVVVSTPKRFTNVCGISIKVPKNALTLVNLHAKNYSSYIGVFKIN